jgi:DNA-binding CsgD family transcriptional regulator
VSLRDGLTKREQEVLAWLHQGMSNKEIALAMAISPRTVQKHLQRIYQWVGVQTRAGLVGVKSIEKKAT